MIFKLNLYSFFVFFLFVSCGQKRVSDSYVLESANKFISFEIDEVTKMPQNSIFSFTDAKGSDFISFQNDNNPEILIYAVQSGDLEKKIKFSTEGSHAIVGGFFGYYIQDFNQIFIPSLYTNTIHVTDTSGLIKQQISYPQTDSGQQLIPFVSNSRAQMCFSDNKIYIPQTLNRMLKDRIIEDSPVGAVIDTVGHHIEALPMRFPKLITKEDIGTSVAFGVEYSRCFDGKTFVYAFFFEEKLYQATPDHKEVKMSIAKSRYIDEVKIVKPKNQDFANVLKESCEHASYGNIIYDKYRKVYYRFTFPEAELESGENYLEIYRSGRKCFSIMILDENLQTIGETLFPEYTYNPNLYILLEDGLYLSTNHIKNPIYSDDKLSFQRIDLIKMR